MQSKEMEKAAELNGKEFQTMSMETLTAMLFRAGGHPRFWLLNYGYSNIPNLFKCFIFDGDIKAASLIGRKHCGVMGYRFNVVTPFIVDLAVQEKLLLEKQERTDGVKTPWD